MREASGLGTGDCRWAARHAEAQLGGDYLLALLVRHAAALAVEIGSADADVSDAQARRDWNLDRALGLRDAFAQRDDSWRRLDAASTRHAPRPTTTDSPDFEGSLSA